MDSDNAAAGPAYLIRRPHAADMLDICTRTLQRLEKSDPTFPRPIAIAPTLVCYKRSEFMAWLKNRPSHAAARAARAAVMQAGKAKKRRGEAGA